MHELLVEWINLVAPWIEAVGIAVVVWGVVEGLLNRVRLSSTSGVELPSLNRVRAAMGEKTTLGLDFVLP